MNVSRRGLFGFMGGAAVAGPKLAQGLAEQALTQSPSVLGYADGYADTATSGSTKPPRDWRLGRIAELKNIIAGGKDPEEERRRTMNRLYSLEAAERYRLDSLRSVSASHKYQMFLDGQDRRQRRIQREQAKFELANLLNQGSF